MDVQFVAVVAALAVALPLALISAAEMYKRHLAFKERELELMAGHNAEQTAQHAARMERLEERMRVLERIATDSGIGVARQIESLRAEPLLRQTEAKEDVN